MTSLGRWTHIWLHGCAVEFGKLSTPLARLDGFDTFAPLLHSVKGRLIAGVASGRLLELVRSNGNTLTLRRQSTDLDSEPILVQSRQDGLLVGTRSGGVYHLPDDGSDNWAKPIHLASAEGHPTAIWPAASRTSVLFTSHGQVISVSPTHEVSTHDIDRPMRFVVRVKTADAPRTYLVFGFSSDRRVSVVSKRRRGDLIEVSSWLPLPFTPTCVTTVANGSTVVAASAEGIFALSAVAAARAFVPRAIADVGSVSCLKSIRTSPKSEIVVGATECGRLLGLAPTRDGDWRILFDKRMDEPIADVQLLPPTAPGAGYERLAVLHRHGTVREVHLYDREFVRSQALRHPSVQSAVAPSSSEDATRFAWTSLTSPSALQRILAVRRHPTRASALGVLAWLQEHTEHVLTADQLIQLTAAVVAFVGRTREHHDLIGHVRNAVRTRMEHYSGGAFRRLEPWRTFLETYLTPRPHQSEDYRLEEQTHRGRRRDGIEFASGAARIAKQGFDTLSRLESRGIYALDARVSSVGAEWIGADQGGSLILGTFDRRQGVSNDHQVIEPSVQGTKTRVVLLPGASREQRPLALAHSSTNPYGQGVEVPPWFSEIAPAFRDRVFTAVPLPNDQLLLCGRDDANPFRIWEVGFPAIKNLRRPKRIKGASPDNLASELATHDVQIWAAKLITIAGEGPWLAVAGGDGYLRFARWDRNGVEAVEQRVDLRSEVRSLVSCCVGSAQQRHLLIAGTKSGAIFVFELNLVRGHLDIRLRRREQVRSCATDLELSTGPDGETRLHVMDLAGYLSTFLLWPALGRSVSAERERSLKLLPVGSRLKWLGASDFVVGGWPRPGEARAHLEIVRLHRRSLVTVRQRDVALDRARAQVRSFDAEQADDILRAIPMPDTALAGALVRGSIDAMTEENLRHLVGRALASRHCHFELKETLDAVYSRLLHQAPPQEREKVAHAVLDAILDEDGRVMRSEGLRPALYIAVVRRIIRPVFLNSISPDRADRVLLFLSQGLQSRHDSVRRETLRALALYLRNLSLTESDRDRVLPGDDKPDRGLPSREAHLLGLVARILAREGVAHTDAETALSPHAWLATSVIVNLVRCLPEATIWIADGLASHWVAPAHVRIVISRLNNSKDARVRRKLEHFFPWGTTPSYQLMLGRVARSSQDGLDIVRGTTDDRYFKDPAVHGEVAGSPRTTEARAGTGTGVLFDKLHRFLSCASVPDIWAAIERYRLSDCRLSHESTMLTRAAEWTDEFCHNMPSPPSRTSGDAPEDGIPLADFVLANEQPLLALAAQVPPPLQDVLRGILERWHSILFPRFIALPEQYGTYRRLSPPPGTGQLASRVLFDVEGDDRYKLLVAADRTSEETRHLERVWQAIAKLSRTSGSALIHIKDVVGGTPADAPPVETLDLDGPRTRRHSRQERRNASPPGLVMARKPGINLNRAWEKLISGTTHERTETARNLLWDVGRQLQELHQADLFHGELNRRSILVAEPPAGGQSTRRVFFLTDFTGSGGRLVSEADDVLRAFMQNREGWQARHVRWLEQQRSEIEDLLVLVVCLLQGRPDVRWPTTDEGLALASEAGGWVASVGEACRLMRRSEVCSRTWLDKLLEELPIGSPTTPRPWDGTIP